MPYPGLKPSVTSGRPNRARLDAHAQVLRDGEHEPAAEGVLVDRGDRHLRQRGEPVHEGRVAVRERLGVVGRDGLHLLDAARAEARPATTSTLTSAMAATRSSVSSSAPVSARLSALRAFRAVEPQPGDAGARSSSTIGAVAIAPEAIASRAPARPA